MATAALRPEVQAPVRRARVAVALMFLTNGAVFANLLPRYPRIKADLGLSNAALGAALAAFPLGALIAGLAAGSLIQRFRSSRVGVLGTAGLGLAILAAGVSRNWLMLAAALFVGGALDALVDVAQNAHGLRVQRHYGRSILNSFHALWSVGAVTGGLTGSAAAGLGLPLGLHLALSGAVISVIAAGCYPFMLPGPESAGRGPAATVPGRVDRTVRRPAWLTRRNVVALLALGVIACCGTITEDAGASWGALYLSDDLGTDAAVAGLAFVALQGMQFIGRVLGDRLIDRFGQRATARAGGAISLVGMGSALAWPSVSMTVAGFGAAGLGMATLVPAAMHGADQMPGLPPGAGLTVVTWLLRVGFLVSPPVVGLVADGISLRAGLLLVPLAGAVVIGLSRFLLGRPPRVSKGSLLQSS